MKRELHYQSAGETRTVTIEETDGGYRVQVGERAYTVAVVSARPGPAHRLVLDVDGQRVRAVVAQEGGRTFVHLAGAEEGGPWTLERAATRRPRAGAQAAAASGVLGAAMPGRVLDVLVVEGDRVRRGDTLVLLEAMKMELRIPAPADGVVARVLCRAGEVVEKGQPLIEVTDVGAVS
jgi:biotin carboxyl carrier protein